MPVKNSFVPNEILEVLGDISLNFVYLEQLIFSIISNSFEIGSHFIDILIGGDDFRPIVSKFKKSVIYVLDSNRISKDDKLYKDFEKILIELKGAQADRNKYFHGFMRENPFKNIIEFHKFKRDIDNKDHSIIEFDEITIDKLNKANSRIKTCHLLLSLFEQEIIKLPSLKKTYNPLAQPIRSQDENDKSETKS